MPALGLGLLLLHEPVREQKLEIPLDLVHLEELLDEDFFIRVGLSERLELQQRVHVPLQNFELDLRHQIEVVVDQLLIDHDPREKLLREPLRRGLDPLLPEREI